MTSDQKLQVLLAENVSLRSRITNLVAEAEIQERKWKVRVDREAGRVLLRDEAIEALAQRCIDLAAESASFESRWRELGEALQHGASAPSGLRSRARGEPRSPPLIHRSTRTTMTTTTKTTHFFLRNLDGHRVGVVALRYKAETDKGAGVTVAVSLCHANDPWRSSTGVAAARGRLDANLGWDGRRSNLSYRVDDQVALQDDVFRILTPNGIRKKRDDIDWVRMQALFTKQWTYLTTPPDPSAVKRDPSPRVPTRSGYYWARRKTETPGSSSWSVVRVAEYADGLKIYDEHDIAMDRWEWSARLPAPDEGNKS